MSELFPTTMVNSTSKAAGSAAALLFDYIAIAMG